MVGFGDELWEFYLRKKQKMAMKPREINFWFGGNGTKQTFVLNACNDMIQRGKSTGCGDQPVTSVISPYVIILLAGRGLIVDGRHRLWSVTNSNKYRRLLPSIRSSSKVAAKVEAPVWSGLCKDGR